MKLYNAVSKHEQLLAEMYVYLLHSDTEGAYYKKQSDLDSF
jgi:hypothetical protein